MTDTTVDEEQVYTPAEDSMLLAEACVERLEPGDTVVDVGTGSGFIAATIQAAHDGLVVGMDINPHACRLATAEGIPAIRGDLLTPLRADSADVIVANPPYLPHNPATDQEDWLTVAVDGGETGRAIVDRLIPALPRVLRPQGRAVLLLSSLMGIDDVLELARSHGLEGKEIARDESFPFEVLAVYVFDRSP